MIDIHKIRLPKKMMRAKNEKHLQETSKKLRKFRWPPSLASIAVAILEVVRAADVIEGNEKLVDLVVFVDVNHRIRVLLEVEKEGAKWSHIVAVLNVTLWERKDEKNIT